MLQVSQPNFNQVFRASRSTFLSISVSIARTAYLLQIFGGFRDFLKANNSEAAEAYPLKLRLHPESSRGYEPAKSELSKVIFRTFDPLSSPGWEWADRTTTGR
jgi:hypothetical protein